MLNFRIISTVLFLAISATAVSYAAEPAKPKAAEKPAPKKELTKPDIIEHIKGSLDHFDEILNFVPGLQKYTDAAGKATYKYQDKPLEDLDKDQLMKLYFRVSNEAVRLRTDRVNKQLETIRRSEQASRRAAMPARPPTAYIPPKLPPAHPSAVTRPPKIPAPPPAPPKR